MTRWVNTLGPRQNGRHFADDIFKCIFLNENIIISIKISLKFLPKAPINNIPALVQIMAWRRPGDKPLSETMMVSLLTHICVTRPQWVKCNHIHVWHLSVWHRWNQRRVALECDADHNDAIKWKHFPRYWSFMRGIHRPPMNSPHKGLWSGAFMLFFDLRRHRGH